MKKFLIFALLSSLFAITSSFATPPYIYISRFYEHVILSDDLTKQGYYIGPVTITDIASIVHKSYQQEAPNIFYASVGVTILCNKMNVVFTLYNNQEISQGKYNVRVTCTALSGFPVKGTIRHQIESDDNLHKSFGYKIFTDSGHYNVINVFISNVKPT